MYKKELPKWGLMTKPDSEQGKWHLVTSARFIFDNETEALRSALTMTQADRYLYRPVPLTISVEADTRDWK